MGADDGLSDLQRRILEYVASLKPSMGGAVPWLDGACVSFKREIRAAILPDRDPDDWTAADRAAVCRAVSRLEKRKLVFRVKKKRRTWGLVPAPERARKAVNTLPQTQDVNPPEKKGRTLDEAIVRMKEIARREFANWPEPYREAMGHQLVSLGEQILRLGELRP